MIYFADDHIRSAWGETLYKLIGALESKSNIANEWLTKSGKIINQDKLQIIILDEKKSNLSKNSVDCW